MCQFIEDEEEEVFESEEEITFYPTRREVVLPLFDESIWMTGEDLLKALHIGDIFQVDRREEGMDFAIYVGGTGAVHAVHSAGRNVAHVNLEPVRKICQNYACRLFNFVEVARKKGLQPLSRLDSVRNAKNLVGLPLRAEYGRRPEYLPTKCVYNARLSFPRDDQDDGESAGIRGRLDALIVNDGEVPTNENGRLEQEGAAVAQIQQNDDQDLNDGQDAPNQEDP